MIDTLTKIWSFLVCLIGKLDLGMQKVFKEGLKKFSKEFSKPIF